MADDELALLRFCSHLDEPSLELPGLDAVLAATTFTGADAALGGPRVFGPLLKHHRGQDRKTGTPRSAASNTPPTDDMETAKHPRQHNPSAREPPIGNHAWRIRSLSTTDRSAKTHSSSRQQHAGPSAI